MMNHSTEGFRNSSPLSIFSSLVVMQSDCSRPHEEDGHSKREGKVPIRWLHKSVLNVKIPESLFVHSFMDEMCSRFGDPTLIN